MESRGYDGEEVADLRAFWQSPDDTFSADD